MTRGLLALLSAQFISALADNALLFLAIALLINGNFPSWGVPALQESFIVAYIVLAPFAGPLAEILPKARVMMGANLLKFVGAALMLSGFNAFGAYALVGLGAALYSPAKYGILRELVPTAALVKANGQLEASTIVAILAGVLVGGWFSETALIAGLWVTAGLYLFAALANIFIPNVGGSGRWSELNPRTVFRQFFGDVRKLWADRATRLSLLGTGAFWSAGATLRLYLVAWVPIALALTDKQTPAYLNACVALGIVAGAALAGWKVPLEQAPRVVPAGVALGAVVTALAIVTSLPATIAMLALIGVLGGILVVPLNALLQERGHAIAGSGPAIAVQNLFENAGMFLMVGFYAVLSQAPISVPAQGLVLGVALLVAMGALLRWQQKALPAY